MSVDATKRQERTAPMSDAAYDMTILSAEDYLERENDGQIRHEFVNGVLYAMGGASDWHNLVAGTIYAALLGHLPDSCEAFMSDMKLRIRAEKAEFFYYPDVLVSCAASDRESYYREEPILLVEVLSPTTERIDRSEKYDNYCKIPSLQEYVLVAQDNPRVEIFRRARSWQREIFLAGSDVTFESVDLTMSLEAIYRRIKF